jgi:hypothetical protein
MNLIRETIKSRQWKTEDLKCSPWVNDASFKIGTSVWLTHPTSAVANRQLAAQPPGPPHQLGFIKINFDGASKGNPGPAGFGAILRNSNGEILHLVAGFLGSTQTMLLSSGAS